MTKEEFMKHLPNGTYGLLSTVRPDGMPEARGWEFQFAENNRFYFATANNKDVYQQLKEHPQAAFTYMEPTGKFTVRVTGKVAFVAEPQEKARLWEKIDKLVQGMYKSWDNPIFEIMYLDDCALKFAQGFAPTKTVE